MLSHYIDAATLLASRVPCVAMPYARRGITHTRLRDAHYRSVTVRQCFRCLRLPYFAAIIAIISPVCFTPYAAPHLLRLEIDAAAFHALRWRVAAAALPPRCRYDTGAAYYAVSPLLASTPRYINKYRIISRRAIRCHTDVFRRLIFFHATPDDAAAALRCRLYAFDFRQILIFSPVCY